MALSVEECRQMVEAADEAGVALQIGYVMRFSEHIETIQNWLEQIGRPALAQNLD